MEKKIELLQVDENGQVFVDWESLEALTNATVVGHIKHYLSNFSDAVVNSIKVTPDYLGDFTIEVRVLRSGLLTVFNYFTFTKSFNCMHLSRYDLEDYASILGLEVK